MAAVAAGSMYHKGWLDTTYCRSPYGKMAVVKPRQVGPYSMVTGRKAQQLKANSPADHLGSAKRVEVLEDHGNVFNCSSVDQWHGPEADKYQGLRVARSIDPFEWQFVADQLSWEVEGDIHHEIIELGPSDGIQRTDGSLQHKFQNAAHAVSSRLPPVLAKIVCEDAQALADATCKLLPDARRLIIGLQLFGDNTCSRWHQDDILCRSIVSYNCSGTQYTADSNVDFNEMINCGKSDHVIRDKSRIHSLNVGDILLMKGKKYPGKGQGLVHKSPEVRYSDNGYVLSRLVLKVEVQDMAGGKVENSCTGD